MINVTNSYYVFMGSEYKLGEGSYGTVYKGVSKFTKSLVAIKVISKDCSKFYKLI